MQNHIQSTAANQTTAQTTAQAIEFKSKANQVNQLLKHDQSQTYELQDVLALLDLPFNDLLWQAQNIHRQHFSANEVQCSTLLSIKTGGCPENCSYCPQSAHYDTGVQASKLLDVEEVLAAATEAKAAGASRFCMGAAWRGPKDRDIEKVEKLITAVKDLGLETCATLGLLDEGHAEQLKSAGLDYYNHNLDTSPDYYEEIIQTRTFEDRLDTLAKVRNAGIKVCCGGIVGMGETREQRAAFLVSLANLSPQPESVPINALVAVEGTPLADQQSNHDDIEFIKTIACARILMPKSRVRLSAGRETMSESTQALCFLAGANSIFYGDKLLTTENPQTLKDQAMMKKLGIHLI
jgi:biotin synthase